MEGGALCPPAASSACGRCPVSLFLERHLTGPGHLAVQPRLPFLASSQWGRPQWPFPASKVGASVFTGPYVLQENVAPFSGRGM